MDSSNLDETRPTSFNSDEQSQAHAPENASGAAKLEDQQETDVTQPSPVAAVSARDSGDYTSPGGSPPSQVVQKQQIDETQRTAKSDDGINLPPVIPDEPPEKPRRRPLWIIWAILGVLILALIAAGSAYAGYNSAVKERTLHAQSQVAGEAANQYVLAQQDIALGNFDRARQRLEYIIQLDPNYPNVSDQLASVLTQLRITATPTFAPTPTLTPTPDFRGRDELFTQSQDMLNARQWTDAINTLLLLRKNYPDYLAVKVDDMLYVALRNRGIEKISQGHDLEGGNYDLTLAERFGPLDAEAENWREWAELYIRGASYWDVDWAQAVYYFSQLGPAAPNLMDASGWTAANRYLDALLGYGDWLAAKGQWCDAQQQYDTYMSIVASSQVEPTAVNAANLCAQGTPAPPPPTGDTATPTPTSPAGELTPTPTPPVPTPTETQQAGLTPYP
jgi:tetratricopeptide (TPR) repeat protein